jgi:nitrogen fixation protein NifX
MSLRIAFASSDRQRVDQHFGAAEAFAVYVVEPPAARLVEVAEFSEADVLMDGHEGKLARKIELLGGCAAVYCVAVGGSAIKQLLAAGIQPMKVEEGVAIDDCLGELLGSVQSGTSPLWLRKALQGGRDEKRFDELLSEAWQE